VPWPGYYPAGQSGKLPNDRGFQVHGGNCPLRGYGPAYQSGFRQVPNELGRLAQESLGQNAKLIPDGGRFILRIHPIQQETADKVVSCTIEILE